MNKDILLPIKTAYVDLIEEGLKKGEFRRKPAKEQPVRIWIGATLPVSRLVGFVYCTNMIVANSYDELIAITGTENIGISEHDLKIYFKGAKQFVAYKIDDINIMANLGDPEGGQTFKETGLKAAPQGMIYVEAYGKKEFIKFNIGWSE